MTAERRAALALADAEASRDRLEGDLGRAGDAIEETINALLPAGWTSVVTQVDLSNDFRVMLVDPGDEVVRDAPFWFDASGDGGLLVDGEDLAVWVRAVLP